MRLLLRIVCLAGALLAALPIYADVAVKGYTRKDGTYVAPHMRSDPNSTKNDNFSTVGNVNPYTGKLGTKPGDGGTTSLVPASDLVAPTPTSAVVSTQTAAVASANPAIAPASNPTALSDHQLLLLLLDKVSALEARLGTADQKVFQQTSVVPSGSIGVPTSALPPTIQAWRGLKNGMPEDRVKALLGEPVRIANNFWYYPNGGRIYFFLGSVSRWEEPQ